MGTTHLEPTAATRAELIDIITNNAIIHGDVQLSSGAKASYYVDLRRVTLHHRGAALIGVHLRDLLSSWQFDHIGGLTMGADPVATAVMHAPGRPIDAFVVRKSVKAHGLNRIIEGPDIVGKNVVIVEDSSTTGSSALQAARTATEHGAHVVGIAAVVDRATGAQQKITEAGFTYTYLFGLDDLGLSKQL